MEIGAHAMGLLAIHFEVSDIFAAVERILKSGAKVGRPKKQIELGFYECSFQDPDGNEFELIQPL
ncbi:MAG: VOC family protein [Candidatus Thermoplasmatota archaeon]|nr:VOC family protein [Candidatus Thermoplasmatota archaeon]